MFLFCFCFCQNYTPVLFSWQLIHLQAHKNTSECSSTLPPKLFYACTYSGSTGWVAGGRCTCTHTCCTLVDCLSIPRTSLSVSLSLSLSPSHTLTGHPVWVSPHVIRINCGISRTAPFFHVRLLQLCLQKCFFLQFILHASHTFTCEPSPAGWHVTSLARWLLRYTRFGMEHSRPSRPVVGSLSRKTFAAV